MNDNSDSDLRRGFVLAHNFSRCFDGDTSDKHFRHMVKQLLAIRIRTLERERTEKHNSTHISCDENCMKTNKKLNFINKVIETIEQIYEQEN